MTEQTELKQNPYGYCPHCGEKGILRERRPGGNDECASGHIYPSASALKEPNTRPSIWHDIDLEDESTWPKIEDKEILSEFDCASIDFGRVTAQCNGLPPLISYFISPESTSKNLKRWARLEDILKMG